MAKNKEQVKNQPQQQSQQGKEQYTVKDYIFINLFFWLFLCAIALVVYMTTGAKWDAVMGSVFTFIFLVFGGGFTAVSIFDFVYDRAAGKSNEEKQ
jgi:uncharacterized membrane-anchored protein